MQFLFLQNDRALCKPSKLIFKVTHSLIKLFIRLNLLHYLIIITYKIFIIINLKIISLYFLYICSDAKFFSFNIFIKLIILNTALNKKYNIYYLKF